MSNLAEPPVVCRRWRGVGPRVGDVADSAGGRRDRRLAGVGHAVQGRPDDHAVTFDNAEGLQAGQSQLKFKDIVFGTVKSLDLTPDH